MNIDKHIPQGYKDSPLGIIPEEWEVKRLGDCFDISAGRDLLKDKYSPKPSPTHRYPIYSNSLENKGLYGYTSTPRHKGNCITITGRGTLGHAEFRNQDFDAIVRLLVLTPKFDISCWLIANYINFASPFIYESTGVPQLTAPQINNIKILLPPYNEQIAIANVLRLWDTAIEKQSVLIEKLKLRKRELMQQLLTGKKRLPGFSGEWKSDKIEDHFKLNDDKNDGKGHIPMTISAKLGFVSQKDKFDRIVAGNSLDKYTLLKKGDFAYNKGNSNLYEMGCIYLLEEISAVVPFVYICFRAFDNTCCDFYKHFFINHGLDSQLNRIITSGARSDGLLNVNSTEFMALRIPYPSVKEQIAIANILNVADKEIELANEKLANLQSQKRGLLQHLLTGKKRII